MAAGNTVIRDYLDEFIAFLEETGKRATELVPQSALSTPEMVNNGTRFGFRNFPVPPTQGIWSRRTANATPSEKGNAARSFAHFDQAFTEYKGRVLLLGAPGAGKTTALWNFAYEAAQRCRARLNAAGNPKIPLPLLCYVRDWDQKMPLVDWAWAQAGKSGVPTPEKTLPFLYLFDGLDELGGKRPKDPNQPNGEQYDPRADFLHAVASQLQGASVVLSCRVVDFADVGEKAALDGAVTLLDLEPDQIQAFLVQQNLSGLWNVLSGNPALLSLACNPLLLSLLFQVMLVMQEAGEDGEQTLTRAFAEQGASEATVFNLYIRARFEHENSKGMVSFTEAETRLRLGILAAAMWDYSESPATTLTREDVESLLGEGDQVFLKFAYSMHLLRETSRNEVEFIHLKFRDYCALPVLMQPLNDPDKFVRWGAVRTLGQVGNTEAVSTLVRLLEEADDAVRGTAVEALGAIKNLGQVANAETISALSQSAGSSNPTVRWAAVRVLALAGNPKAITTLTQALDDSDEYVCMDAAETLGDIGSVQAIPALARLLDGPDSHVKWAAVKALGKMEKVEAVPALVRLLNDSESNLRWEAALALGEVESTEALTALMQVVDGQDRDHLDRFVRWVAIRSLGQAGNTEAISALVRLLKDTDSEIQESAAWALGEVGTTEATTTLMQALNNSDSHIRIIAAQGFGRVGNEEAVATLIRLLDDPEGVVRRTAAETLGDIESIQAIPALVQLLSDSESDVRWAAAQALGYLGSAQAIPALLQGLDNSDNFVRERAVDALRKVGQATVPALIELLKDQNASNVAREGAVIALGQMWRTAASALRRALNHPDVWVHRKVFLLLGGFKDAAAIPAYLAALNDTDREVRENAIAALVRVGALAIPALRQALKAKNSHIRAKARQALARWDEPKLSLARNRRRRLHPARSKPRHR